jgi:hypothetical protein
MPRTAGNRGAEAAQRIPPFLTTGAPHVSLRDGRIIIRPTSMLAPVPLFRRTRGDPNNFTWMVLFYCKQTIFNDI